MSAEDLINLIMIVKYNLTIAETQTSTEAVI